MSSINLIAAFQEHHRRFGVFTFRLLLLSLVIVLLILNPADVTITEMEIRNVRFQRPRKASLVPPWLMYLLLIVFPNALFCYPLLHGDMDSTRRAWLSWSLAMLLTAVVTEAVKMYFKAPRPDFFFRCFPDGQVQGLFCTGRARMVKEGRKSFPSGHSSFSFCSFGFISLWLMHHFGGLASVWERLEAKVLCAIPMFVALFLAWSRYYDNHHHWQDVFVGSIVGFLCTCASYYYYYVSDYAVFTDLDFYSVN